MKKRLLSGLVLLALLLQCLLLPAFAEPTDAPADPTEPSASETVADATEPDASEPGATDAAEPTAETAAPAENDKAPAAVTDETPPALNDFGQYLDTTVQAKAAALVELNSDTLVYGMNLDEKVYPASLTKIMTCMLALEHGNLDDIVTVSHEALQDLNAAGSSAGLLEGEQLSLRELLYCVMISSANEACNVVAEYIAGDIPSFVALMNAQAAALGMTGTHFANAHGLHDENHYTTVRDLVTLARWAWQSEQFQEFSTQTSHTVPATNKSEERVLHTTNYLTSGQTVGKPVELTAREFDLVELLIRNPNRVYSRENLLDLIWSYEYRSDIRTVDVHIRRIREKLETVPAEPEYIMTKWGVGYYFKA